MPLTQRAKNGRLVLARVRERVRQAIGCDRAKFEHRAGGNGPTELFGKVQNMLGWSELQLRRMIQLVRDPSVKTYCEIGVNGGHSAAAMLLANPELVVHGFDLMAWR